MRSCWCRPQGGASCSSTRSEEAVRETEQALLDFKQNNAPCGESCAGTEVRTCGDECVTPVANGQACSQTDCLSNSVCADSTASCRTVGGVTQCVPDDSVANTHGFTLWDDGSAEPSACDADLFCRDYARCFPNSANYGDRCVVGSPQDSYCDSSWLTPSCFPCMPGSSCWFSVQNDDFGYCKSLCSADEDCPCDDDGSTRPYTCHDGVCKLCRSLGQTCSEHQRCCDANTECGIIADTNFEGEFCCKPEGQSCSTNRECCQDAGGNVRCSSAGICADCKNNGLTCVSDNDCCSNRCASGVCVDAGDDCLNEGEPCKADADGVCKDGVIECDTAGQPQCKAGTPTTETCNGKDDDCDGDTDDIAPSGTCSVHPPECSSRPSFEATGKKYCTGKGVEECQAVPGADFCFTPGSESNGLPCGDPFGATCTDNSDCAPNLKCIENCLGAKACRTHYVNCPSGDDGAAVCSGAPGVPQCWMPSENGTCL